MPIDEARLGEIAHVVEGAGIQLSPSPSVGADTDAADDAWRHGWDGGVIMLVPTDKPLAEWKPIAMRAL